MKRSLVPYECIYTEGVRDVEKKKLCKISQFFASFSINSKNALIPDLNDYSLFGEK